MSMALASPDTDALLNRVGQGDSSAKGPLLERHRQRLRQMVAIRLDRRLQARIDPSDVVQDALGEAAGKLSHYVARRPLPFYPWLRRIAWERIIHLHRRHIRAGRRSVVREQVGLPLPDESASMLADRLMVASSSPSKRVQRNEERDRLQSALLRLSEADREVLVLRYLEHLSTREIAAVLDLAESGVKARQLRALQRLRILMGDNHTEDAP
jgi:RNA polymerase sigma-70 factor (ECF subfamily)